MSSWAALNARPSSDNRDQSAALEQATEEAQDAEHTAMYEQALRCQQRHEHAAAKTLYSALLHSAFRTPTRLVYLCYKNLASLAFEVRSFEDALPSFSRAVSLDATDVVVWYQMATSAVETGKLWLARRALEEGFKVDATYWPLVEMLALVLHVLKDDGAYERVAQYLRERDPQCASVRVIDAMRRSGVAQEMEMERLSGDKLVLRRARKRLRHVEEIVERGAKRRRELERESADRRRKEVGRRRTYTLWQASWTRLGELLLEAFDEIHQDVEAHVLLTEVEIRVGFCDKEVEDCAAGEAEKEVDRDGGVPLSNSVQLKGTVEVTAAGGGCDTPLLTEVSDNDTQDSGKNANGAMVDQPRRRKSRRREKRLWQEQAAAIKRAREQDLAYRLQAFLPTNFGDEEKDATLESVLSEWLPSLTVEYADGNFCIVDTRNEVLIELASFAISTEEPASHSDTSSSRMRSPEQEAHEVTLQPEMVTARQIVSFITGSAGGNTRPGVIIDWVRRYLNQCGQWSLLHLDDDVGKIHKVCAWLEKAINGDLDISKSETSIQPTVINVPDHSLIQNSRFERNGLSPYARLFLLELRFDALLQRFLRGRRMCGMERLLEVQLAQAETLMFEFGWLEDAENTGCDPNGGELLRLLWLIARMHERCGNPRMAQHYFAKCREKVAGLNEEGEENADFRFRIYLPNQSAGLEITLEQLNIKISGLRLSDVYSEARDYFEAGDYDHAASVLLKHFYPRNRVPRVADFLNEFWSEEDGHSANGDRNELFEMVYSSLGQSTIYSEEDSILFLLTTLYHVIACLDGPATGKELGLRMNSSDKTYLNAMYTMKFLLTQLTQNKLEHVTNPDHRLLLSGLCVKCLQPSTLFRFDSPNIVLSMISVVLEVIENRASATRDNGASMQRAIGVDAMARLLYAITSLSGGDFRGLCSPVPHPAKRKMLRRDRIRVVVVEVLRFLNRAFRNDDEIAVSFPLQKRSALMNLCIMLMKEEEENVAQSDSKTPKQLFGNGAILFLQLHESWSRAHLTTSPIQLVELIHLFHERLGQYGICGLTYFSDISPAGDARKSLCFLETSAVLLSKFVQKAHFWDGGEYAKALDGDIDGEDKANADLSEGEINCQTELLQCYRCLYDVQILPGCEDHKAGSTFASLQGAKVPVKYDDAMRLVRFAVPVFLASKAKNNGQKKERQKLLCAVREALSDSGVAAFVAQPVTVPPSLQVYLAPGGLLQENATLPFPLDAVSFMAKSPDEVCVSHLWYLLGANCILGRVKRRGNLDELIELEQRVRERVEYLMKDVLYYHPDRVDTWIHLGKTMKELYHAATDAIAAILGRNLRVQAYLWYTTTILASDTEHLEGQHTRSIPDVYSFQNVVLEWGLFKKLKLWQERLVDGRKTGSKAVSPEDRNEKTDANGAYDQLSQSQVPVEEYATMYIFQVVEFARRCFDMAAQLANEGTKKHQSRQFDKHGNSDNDVVGAGSTFDEAPISLRNIIFECYEECGLLLYSLLQEFSLIKEMNDAAFPHEAYSRLIDKTLSYFQEGWSLCRSNENAHEDHFRLQYMIGKTLKKRRWCELFRQQYSDPEALSTAKEMAGHFSSAESARAVGDREYALVHAFHSLQALRIELIICDSPSVGALRLVCGHFYEGMESGDEKGDTDEDVAEDNSIQLGDEKNSSEEEHLSTTLKTVSRQATAARDTTCASTVKKDEIVALLTATEDNDTVSDLNVTLARGWLALNIIEALESIPEEDRYFHPSRYKLARIVYWLSTFYSALEQGEHTDDGIDALLVAVRVHRCKDKTKGSCVAAARALKEMAPIFDKRRPQVVAIWFSEYIPTAKKFEELNQRQMKYDYYRLKYWRFFIALLQENAEYGRLKEVETWVLACKEDHDVIDIMLGIVLKARGQVLRVRLLEVLNRTEGVGIGSGVDAVRQIQSPSGDRFAREFLKELAKAYTYYTDLLNAQLRLARVMNDSKLWLEKAQLSMVVLFLVGVMKCPSEMVLLQEDAVIMDHEFHANVAAIKQALVRHELPARIDDAHGQEAWEMYWTAAYSFCENKWPERVGKGKSIKKLSRPRTVGAVASVIATCQLSSTGSSS